MEIDTVDLHVRQLTKRVDKLEAEVIELRALVKELSARPTYQRPLGDSTVSSAVQSQN